MKHFKKLNAKGFGHIELIVIIATIAVIGGIGSYVMLKRSHAATGCTNATTCTYGSWHTVASTGPISHVIKNGYSDLFLTSYTIPRYSTYKTCVTAQAYGRSSSTGYFVVNYSGHYANYGTSSSTSCSQGTTGSSAASGTVSVKASGALLVQKVYIQRYY